MNQKYLAAHTCWIIESLRRGNSEKPDSMKDYSGNLSSEIRKVTLENQDEPLLEQGSAPFRCALIARAAIVRLVQAAIV